MTENFHGNRSINGKNFLRCLTDQNTFVFFIMGFVWNFQLAHASGKQCLCLQQECNLYNFLLEKKHTGNKYCFKNSIHYIQCCKL